MRYAKYHFPHGYWYFAQRNATEIFELEMLEQSITRNRALLSKMSGGFSSAQQSMTAAAKAQPIYGATLWNSTCTICTKSLGATARSYRRQDGADAAARFEKFLPAPASLRPPISLKFATE